MCVGERDDDARDRVGKEFHARPAVRVADGTVLERTLDASERALHDGLLAGDDRREVDIRCLDGLPSGVEKRIARVE